jgi:hypothetical protein
MFNVFQEDPCESLPTTESEKPLCTIHRSKAEGLEEIHSRHRASKH